MITIHTSVYQGTTTQYCYLPENEYAFCCSHLVINKPKKSYYSTTWQEWRAKNNRKKKKGGTKSFTLPGKRWTWFGSSSLLANLLILKFGISRSAGQTCSSFFPVVQLLTQTPLISPPFCGTSQPKADVLWSHFSAVTTLMCLGLQSRTANPERVSVIDDFLKTNVAALKKTFKNNIVHPFCYLFPKQERETWSSESELCKLRLILNKTELSDFQKEEKNSRLQFAHWAFTAKPTRWICTVFWASPWWGKVLANTPTLCVCVWYRV